VKAIRALCTAILFGIAGLATPAWATSATTDQSDLWWVPTESGWGIQLVQRDSILFATMFVYDATNVPIWYTATLSYRGDFVWTGDLYLTNGPWFGSEPFKPNAVGYRRVGTMTWTATTITDGALAYVVDGVTVTKSPTRQFLAFDNFNGHYGGGTHADTTGCVNPAFNGLTEDLGILNITQNGQTVGMAVLPTKGGSCSFSGTLTQSGQMGAVSGSYVCSDGDAGAFNLFEMQVNVTGVTGRFTTSSTTLTGCQSAGWFGGLRVTTY